MLLIGGYTHYPVGIPAKAGEGVALFGRIPLIDFQFKSKQKSTLNRTSKTGQ